MLYSVNIFRELYIYFKVCKYIITLAYDKSCEKKVRVTTMEGMDQ